MTQTSYVSKDNHLRVFEFRNCFSQTPAIANGNDKTVTESANPSKPFVVNGSSTSSIVSSHFAEPFCFSSCLQFFKLLLKDNRVAQHSINLVFLFYVEIGVDPPVQAG